MMKKSRTLGIVLLAALASSGCAGAQTQDRDFQVMEAAHRAESAQAQRTILELRAEVQILQRELGASRVGLARLEGDLRDTRGRLAEAQRAVEAQRDEVARLREDRERAAQAARETEGQLVELGRLRQQVADAAREQTRLAALETAVEKQAREVADLKAAAQKATVRVKPARSKARAAEPTLKGAIKQAVFQDAPAQ